MKSWIRGAVGALVLLMVPSAGVQAQSAPLGTPMPTRPLGDALGEEIGLPAFLAHQLSFERVADARDATDDSLQALFQARGVDYGEPEIYLRVLKHERILELWARDDADSAFTLIKEYPVCALPGQLGPKQQMGDFQVPEGFYFIDEFNPQSNYHLSLRISYPNMADRIRREARSLGGDIFVHGGCETVGCVPIEDRNIQEVYWLAARATEGGQRIIPIHIFPSRMDEETLRWLRRTFQPEPELAEFWQNLAEGYAYFERTRRVPWITVAQDGRYHVPRSERLAERESAPGDTLGPSGEILGLPGDIVAVPAATPLSGDTLAADSLAAPATNGGG